MNKIHNTVVSEFGLESNSKIGRIQVHRKLVYLVRLATGYISINLGSIKILSIRKI